MPTRLAPAAAPTGAGPSVPAPAIGASAYMVMAMLAFSCMGALIRISSSHAPVLEVVFFRNAFAVMLFAPLLLRRGFGMLRTTRLRLHVLRNLVGAAAMSAGFAGVTMIPLAQSQALGFTTPLFTTIGAVLILGERVRIHRIAALAAGFVGVLIVLEPGSIFAGGPPLGAGLALLSSVLVGVSALMMKRLTASDAPEAIALWMVLLQAPISLTAALFVWEWPSLEALAWMLLLACAGTVGHLFWARACARAEMSELQPFEFLKLPVSAALGYLIFDQTPAGAIWLGGAVIFLSTAYISHREARLGKARRVARRIVE